MRKNISVSQVSGFRATSEMERAPRKPNQLPTEKRTQSFNSIIFLHSLSVSVWRCEKERKNILLENFI